MQNLQYHNKDFGDWTNMTPAGVFAARAGSPERMILILEDPTDKEPQKIPYCTGCNITPDYAEFFLSKDKKARIRFDRKV